MTLLLKMRGKKRKSGRRDQLLHTAVGWCPCYYLAYNKYVDSWLFEAKNRP